MNVAQHLWLAFMTEIAVRRCNRRSDALVTQWRKHLNAAGYQDERWAKRKNGTWIRYAGPL